jgi:hypothetical protein
VLQPTASPSTPSVSSIVFFICVFLNATCGVIYRTNFCDVCLLNLLPLPLKLMCSSSSACFALHFHVHFVPRPPVALVLRSAVCPRPQGTRRADSAPHARVAFSTFCVFKTALLCPFCAETACGASAALRALIPAPKVRYAQIQVSRSGPSRGL